MLSSTKNSLATINTLSHSSHKELQSRLRECTLLLMTGRTFLFASGTTEITLPSRFLAFAASPRFIMIPRCLSTYIQ